MPRYIVFSADHDDQTYFIDFLEAANLEAASEQVLDHRDYCCYAIAQTPDDLRDLANACERADNLNTLQDD